MSGESIFLALGELEEDLVREAARPPRRAARPRRLLSIAAAAALLTALLAAAAYSGPILRQYFTAIGDEIIVLDEESANDSLVPRSAALPAPIMARMGMYSLV